MLELEKHWSLQNWFLKIEIIRQINIMKITTTDISLSSAAEIWSPGRQMRPMNPLGDPRSHHRWSVWRPLNSLGFAENISERNRTYDFTVIVVHLYLRLNKARTWIGSFWKFFNRLHGLSRLLIEGPPRTETDHPIINHGWSVGRTRILHFPQHCLRPTHHPSGQTTSTQNVLKTTFWGRPKH